MVAGDQYDIQSELNNFPRIPSNEGDVTTNGIIAAAAIAAVTLVGAIMGGLAGMRFHRGSTAPGWVESSSVLPSAPTPGAPAIRRS